MTSKKKKKKNEKENKNENENCFAIHVPYQCDIF